MAWIIVNRLCKRQKEWMYYGNFDRNFNVMGIGLESKLSLNS